MYAGYVYIFPCRRANLRRIGLRVGRSNEPKSNVRVGENRRLLNNDLGARLPVDNANFPNVFVVPRSPWKRELFENHTVNAGEEGER